MRVRFFNRDVICIRDFFKRRFGYESELYPKFSDIERVDKLDAEIACSGFTKDMAKDIDIELGIITDDDDINNDEQQGTNIESEDEENFNNENQIEPDSVHNNIPNIEEFHSNRSEYSSDCSDGILECGSVRSTATTIHPDEIKMRVRRQRIIKDKRESRKKCVAKGEASAVTRSRRENIHTIKDSSGIWE